MWLVVHLLEVVIGQLLEIRNMGSTLVNEICPFKIVGVPNDLIYEPISYFWIQIDHLCELRIDKTCNWAIRLGLYSLSSRTIVDNGVLINHLAFMQHAQDYIVSRINSFYHIAQTNPCQVNILVFRALLYNHFLRLQQNDLNSLDKEANRIILPFE